MALIRFIPVAEYHYTFLYQLLQEKEPCQNISHKRIPTWEEHCKFNDTKPYKLDYIILGGPVLIGRIYLTYRNEVGIHIKKEFRGKGYGNKALKKFIKDTGLKVYYANIAPKNFKSQKFFKKHGFKLYQYTYERMGR